MTTIEEHKKTAKQFLDDINEKIRADMLVGRQKIIGFSASEAAANLFALLLHTKNLAEPGYNVNHRYFASERIAEKRFDFDIPNKKELLSLLVKQEDYRNKLCYGKEKEKSIVDSAVENLFKIKKEIESLIGEEI